MLSTKGIRIATRTRVLGVLSSRTPLQASHHRSRPRGASSALRVFAATYSQPTLIPSQKRAVSTASASATSSRLPEFSLANKVVLVSGAARGLGLVQAEALLEAGAVVYALDRLETPSSDFTRVQKRATEELGTKFEYRRIDVTDSEALHEIVRKIADEHGRMDGLIAAAGIQQETSALDYTAADAK